MMREKIRDKEENKILKDTIQKKKIKN